MIEYELSRKIIVTFTGFPEESEEDLEDFLDSDIFKAGEWEIVYGDELECTFTETGTLTVYPGRMYMDNGDPGYPDEYEDNLEVDEDYVRDEVQKFLDSKELEDVTFTVVQNEDY